MNRGHTCGQPNQTQRRGWASTEWHSHFKKRQGPQVKDAWTLLWHRERAMLWQNIRIVPCCKAFPKQGSLLTTCGGRMGLLWYGCQWHGGVQYGCDRLVGTRIWEALQGGGTPPPCVHWRKLGFSKILQGKSWMDPWNPWKNLIQNSPHNNFSIQVSSPSPVVNSSIKEARVKNLLVFFDREIKKFDIQILFAFYVVQKFHVKRKQNIGHDGSFPFAEQFKKTTKTS